jgi:hypothetical protein
VYENRVLRRVFWPKRYKIIEGWRKLHNVEIYKLYSSPNINRMVTSRRCVGHVACMGEKGNGTGFW